MSIGKGMLAGFVATLVLSALMVMKSMMGDMPALDLPKMLAGMMGSPDAPMLGWIVHFIIGIVLYGIAIALLGHRLSAKPIVSGLYLGIGGWPVMMILLMPMAGAGVFAITMGLMAPIMTLMLHLIFGAVLGATYGKLVGHDHPAAARRAHA